ncbi:hypothetical protein [Bradyrhizobium sp. NAS96.2]|uniref:hypothetical protein n=1 Tax=Bradyrhizobium sp. NAS96.2 TaxID=1680160 RepID=UPI00093EB466|nr:hypothetical protein [Bradyrhizobium sp. NAS96.2]OKO72128.1 hypothetical protein AC628_26840 [Bradyrhizobium sp. NAS96.2]
MIERPAIRVLEDIIADLDDIPGEERTVVTNLSAIEVISGLWNAFLFGSSDREEDDIVIERWENVFGNVLGAGSVALAAVMMTISISSLWAWSIFNVITVAVGLIGGLASAVNSITGLRSTKRMRGRKSRSDS